jgi:hypothetical protein
MGAGVTAGPRGQEMTTILDRLGTTLSVVSVPDVLKTINYLPCTCHAPCTAVCPPVASPCTVSCACDICTM